MTEPAHDMSEQPVGGDGRRPRRVREIDFSKPTKVAPDQQRRLERAHEGFCRTASTRLTAELRGNFLFEIADCEQVTWGGALGGVPEHSVYQVLWSDETQSEVAIAADVPW